MIGRWGMLVVSAMALCACATHAQREFAAIKTANHNIVSQMKQCTTTIYNSSEYAPLRSHIPYNIRDVTLQQLADTSHASPVEVQAIYATHPKLQACRDTLLNGVSQSEPSLVPIMTADFAKGEDALLDLIQQKVTWGDYMRGVRDRYVQVQADLQAEDRRVVAGLQQENQAEIEQRQRAAQAIAAWAQNQQMINEMNRPVVTNCNAYGNSVNCVTH